jgi:hypothetical protein
MRDNEFTNRWRKEKMIGLRFFLLGLIICLLTACAPSAQVIQTAIAQTQAAMPTATILPTSTPLQNINLVLLANGFALGSTQSITSGKQYVDEQQGSSLSCVVYENGMFTISTLTLDEDKKMEIGKILLSAYGPAVSSWVSTNIANKDFSQPYDQSGTAGSYNIDIAITGQVGWRTLNITVMSNSK